MEELYTRRNIAECIESAWTLISTNPGRVAKALWFPTLLLAILGATGAPLSLSVERGLSLGVPSPTELWLTLVLLVLALLATAFLNAKTYRLLNGQAMPFCLIRAMKAMGVIVVAGTAVTLVMFAISAGNLMLGHTGRLSATAGLLVSLTTSLLATVALFLLTCPLTYVITKYMVEPETTLRQTWKSYRTGLRRLGFITGLVLLCGFLVAIVYCIAALPGVIAMGAAHFSNMGVAYGDPAGLPPNFALIYGATSFITTFVAVLLHVWFTFAQYYMYASIEARNGRADNEGVQEGELKG